MKRILPIVIILGLAIVVVIQYLKIRSLNPPDDYTYSLREDIDLNYYQASAVGDYYEKARELSGYAREVWHNDGIDVRMPDNDDPKDMDAARYYNQLQGYVDALGARLAQSKALKDEGYNNAEVKRLEEGATKEELQVEKTFGGTFFKKGDENNGVWVIQELLIQKGYIMPHDGYYWEETQLAVREYQKKSQLPATGACDIKTLNQLLKK